MQRLFSHFFPQLHISFCSLLLKNDAWAWRSFHNSLECDLFSSMKKLCNKHSCSDFVNIYGDFLFKFFFVWHLCFLLWGDDGGGFCVECVCVCGYRCIECVCVCVWCVRVCICVWCVDVCRCVWCACVACVCFPPSLTLSHVLSNQKFMLLRTSNTMF